MRITGTFKKMPAPRISEPSMDIFKAPRCFSCVVKIVTSALGIMGKLLNFTKAIYSSVKSRLNQFCLLPRVVTSCEIFTFWDNHTNKYKYSSLWPSGLGEIDCACVSPFSLVCPLLWPHSLSWNPSWFSYDCQLLTFLFSIFSLALHDIASIYWANTINAAA